MKKKHYTMSWDIMKAVEAVEAFEKKYGVGHLPYAWLRRIYTGNLLEATHFKKIPDRNIYRVTFKTLLQRDNGEQVQSHTSFKLDTPVTLSELINGMSDCRVRHKSGILTKGWRGAKDEWLKMLDEDFDSSYEAVEAHATINCLV